MAHEISDSRFYAYRKPAWHGVGEVGQVTERVLDIVARKPYLIPGIATRPVSIPLRNGSYHQIPGWESIVACVQSDIGQYPHANKLYNLNHCGFVTKDYHVFPHLGPEAKPGFLNVWNAAIPAYCETLGVLGHGERCFVTAELPGFSVAGDEMKAYLTGLNTCDGKTSVQAWVSSVRAVCANTIRLGLAHSTDHIAINHMQYPAEALEKWLRMVWESAAEKVQVIKDACEILANRSVYADGWGTINASVVYAAVYPLSDKPDTQNLDLLASWEKGNKSQKAHQDTCLTLFESSKTITAATRGTLWGVYNSVVEYEDFAKPRNTATSRFLGISAQRKAKAFDMCMSLV